MSSELFTPLNLPSDPLVILLYQWREWILTEVPPLLCHHYFDKIYECFGCDCERRYDINNLLRDYRVHHFSPFISHFIPPFSSSFWRPSALITHHHSLFLIIIFIFIFPLDKFHIKNANCSISMWWTSNFTVLYLVIMYNITEAMDLSAEINDAIWGRLKCVEI